jgi:hypothetical protein
MRHDIANPVKTETKEKKQVSLTFETATLITTKTSFDLSHVDIDRHVHIKRPTHQVYLISQNNEPFEVFKCNEAKYKTWSIETWKHDITCDLARVPLIRFQVLLTLFPESFSPFHHCTYLLSVSLMYLVLVRIYPQIRTAFSNSPTQWKLTTPWVWLPNDKTTGLSPIYGVLFQATFYQLAIQSDAQSKHYNS